MMATRAEIEHNMRIMRLPVIMTIVAGSLFFGTLIGVVLFLFGWGLSTAMTGLDIGWTISSAALLTYAASRKYGTPTNTHDKVLSQAVSLMEDKNSDHRGEEE